MDLAPGNGVAGEDDFDLGKLHRVGFARRGIAPTLVCPVGTTVHDWDGIAWPAGTTSGNYPLAAIGTMTFSIGISGGSFLNNATYGGQSPTRQNVVTGGFTPAQYSIFQIVDMTGQTGIVTTTMTLPTAVPGAQFRLFDIDYAAGQFADRVTVTGSFNGSPVSPTLTNGVSNYVIGNSADGDVASADNSANGNVVVTFAAPGRHDHHHLWQPQPCPRRPGAAGHGDPRRHLLPPDRQSRRSPRPAASSAIR